jgi:NAD(P)-dependent dehydrogenase (short-subunit alcohol dehydrogenase family)
MSSPITVLITGSARGLGYEAARQLILRGARVVLTGRNAEAGRAEAAELGPLASFVPLDVTDPASLRQALAEVGRQVTRLDVLINNAAVLLDGETPILELGADAFQRTLLTNTVGPLLTTQTFLPLLRKSPSPRVINVSSGAGQLADGTPSTWAPAYSASKAALNAITQQLAGALPGIAVNSMCPGWCRTEMGGSAAPRSPEQGADTMVWLALDAPHATTGKFLRDRQPISW